MLPLKARACIGKGAASNARSTHLNSTFGNIQGKRHLRAIVDTRTARILNDLTRRFYERNADTFSDTRSQAWPGWQRVATECGLDPQTTNREIYVNASPEELCVLDMACGNMRLLDFLAETVRNNKLRYYAIDDCVNLAAKHAPGENATAIETHFQKLDIMKALEHGSLSETIDAPRCHLVACFGFMHHIPLPEWRAQLLSALASHTHCGGYIAIAFWQFLNSPHLASKAERATARAKSELGIELTDPNDKLLGWQEEIDTYRYCHNYTEQEIDELLSLVPAVREVSRFSADGKDHLNRYVILQRI